MGLCGFKLKKFGKNVALQDGELIEEVVPIIDTIASLSRRLTDFYCESGPLSRFYRLSDRYSNVIFDSNFDSTLRTLKIYTDGENWESSERRIVFSDKVNFCHFFYLDESIFMFSYLPPGGIGHRQFLVCVPSGGILNVVLIVDEWRSLYSVKRKISAFRRGYWIDYVMDNLQNRECGLPPESYEKLFGDINDAQIFHPDLAAHYAIINACEESEHGNNDDGWQDILDRLPSYAENSLIWQNLGIESKHFASERFLFAHLRLFSEEEEFKLNIDITFAFEKVDGVATGKFFYVSQEYDQDEQSNDCLLFQKGAWQEKLAKITNSP